MIPDYSLEGMTVISDQNYIAFKLEIPKARGSHNFFSFIIANVWGHAYDDTDSYAQNSRGILMILSHLWANTQYL